MVVLKGHYTNFSGFQVPGVIVIHISQFGNTTTYGYIGIGGSLL